MGLVYVTGTGTGVGKTIVTAAIASLALASGRRVMVVKVAQTGVEPDEPGDVSVIRDLAGPGAVTRELIRFPDPLAPAAAARRSGLPALEVAAVVEELRVDVSRTDLVLVEGAGGLLAPLAPGRTLVDVAEAVPGSVLVVTEPGLGTLNLTALTLAAMEAADLRLAGVVIGRWPAEPGLAERCNLTDLESATGRSLDGALQAGAGNLPPAAFRAAAAAGLSPRWGGAFDAVDFRRRYPE